MLWWQLHEPEAPELTIGPNLEAIFERGSRIGELARTYVPGGVLIEQPYHRVAGRVAATAKALAARVPAIYEASFLEDGVFVSVDILERRRDGVVLVEVKSTVDVKAEHIPDVAIQLHVLRRAGLTVKRADIMYLNRDCRYPDLSNLFVREDVTALASASGHVIPKQIRTLLRTLVGPLPEVAIGPQCTEPYACPLIERCWPPAA
jgi:hypothetical protein